ncbi:heparin lyase I family protein [Shimia haliotis]|uniref:Polysaccharide lyase n=1 Tax=Shimia haliotis TaxID=1280847 RepID=A0A1I4AJ69_9RHOB|nr:heparin lyase I family protein [Shimia haliotis]SFK56525.1 Polysaccharide lyase [Shimia haliotis]
MKVLRLWLLVVFVAMPLGSIAKDFGTDFSRGSSQMKVPHRHNTTAEAATRADGVLTMTVHAGMHGASSDQKNGKERAEYGVRLNDKDVVVRQSFRVRAVSGFPTKTRTMIAQIKFSDTPRGTGSPPVAVYMSESGAAKCNGYGSGQAKADHRRLKGVKLDDGQWHDVMMEVVLSDTNGTCRVFVDGRKVIEQTGLDTHQNGKELMARIGLYRDAMATTQVVQFDDWKVSSSR